jgi:Putative phage replication protein RstA
MDRSAEAGGAFSHPYSNTGIKYQGTGGDSRCIVDWLTCTFEKPSISMHTLISLLADYMQLDVKGTDKGKGRYGFTSCIELEACIDDEYKRFGYISWGGKAQKGRYMLDIEGQGCGLIKDWEALQDTLEGMEARLTRVDLALDFLNGEKTVDDAMAMAKAGEFNMNGCPPEVDQRGDWEIDLTRGRSLYIGKRVCGKQLNVYEKGKQLGDKQSNWTRYELRLGNKGRVIPLDILTDRDKYFAGAYPAFEKLLDGVAGERIKTISKETEAVLTHMVTHMKRCYGKTINQARKLAGFDITEFIEAVSVKGIPNKLDLASRDAQIDWKDFKQRLDDMRTLQ